MSRFCLASRQRLACGWTLILVPVMFSAGCADWCYRRIQLGQSPKEYANILPAETSRRTALGLCHLSDRHFGRTDAIVVLLTADRQVAAKLWAQHWERDWGFNRATLGFRLVGEFDPELYEVQGSGVLDSLRAIAGELADYRGEKLALEAHAWVAAGLVRFLQRWPGVEDAGVTSQRLSELFERVSGGGVARMEVDAHGVYRFEYQQGHVR